MTFDCLTNNFWVDENYKQLFDSASFSKPEDFINKNIGQLVRAEPEKSIRFFEIKQFGKTFGFYLKHDHPKWFTGIKRFIRHQYAYKLAALHELQMIRLYQSQSVSVVIPVAWGEQRICGIPVRGFLIQEQVKGREFTDLAKNGSGAERIKLIRAYGKLVANLHSKGLISSVVRVTDLICTSNVDIKWENITLVIIDREKGKLELEEFSLEKCIVALSSIFLRFNVYIDEPKIKEICYFLKTYLKYLDVEIKPSFRELFWHTNSINACKRTVMKTKITKYDLVEYINGE